MADTDNLDDARGRVLRAHYAGRINRVIDYIEANLAGDLSLDTLASVAAFSPYHFHRIFKTMVGENLSTFIRRRRAEKAASLLLANPARPITGIALECGFSSPGAFARVFRDTFGASATDWLRAGGNLNSKDGRDKSNRSEEARKPREVAPPAARILDPVTRNWSWRVEMETGEAKIEVRDVPEIQVAYLRHIGPYAGDSALFGRLFEQLFSWAGPRGLVGSDTKVFCLYEDDPCITDAAKLRVDVAVSVPTGTATDGAIGTRTIPAGSYAVGHFEVQAEQFGEAWDAMGRWLPQSGYQGSYGPCFEQYLNDASCDPEAKFVVEIHVPVRPL